MLCKHLSQVNQLYHFCQRVFGVAMHISRLRKSHSEADVTKVMRLAHAVLRSS